MLNITYVFDVDVAIISHIYYILLKALLNRWIFNPNLKMATALLLYREEDMVFQNSGVVLLNANPAIVTLFLFTFGTYVNALSLLN